MISRAGDRYFVEGPVTHQSVTALLVEGDRSFDGARVIVDFSKVTEADSSAISMMLEWVRRMRGAGRDISFANLGANLASLVDLYGVAGLIPVAAE